MTSEIRKAFLSDNLSEQKDWVVFARNSEAGHSRPEHVHDVAQLLYAESGVMLLVYPNAGKWILSLLFPAASGALDSGWRPAFPHLYYGNAPQDALLPRGCFKKSVHFDPGDGSV